MIAPRKTKRKPKPQSKRDIIVEMFGEQDTRRMRKLAEIPWVVVKEFFDEYAEAEGEPPSTDYIIWAWGQLQKRKAKLDSVRDAVSAGGWETKLTDRTIQNIIDTGIRGKNLPLSVVACEIALEQNPLTLRGLMYQVVSAGWLPSTDNQHVARLGRLLTILRERGLVPFSWIVDNVRSTDKPSSWSGIGDYIDTVQRCYRKDFWASLAEYVHVFVEKDAVAGTISPVTREFDVALSPIRGYVSLSYAHEIADQWNQIEKPIFAYYLGDFDPSGFDLERDVREKLERYCDHGFAWKRLAVLPEDFDEFNLIPLAVKVKDKRAAKFRERHGDQCAEVDAIPATELRRRVREAIEGHIPTEEWDRLKSVEAAERESFVGVLESLR